MILRVEHCNRSIKFFVESLKQIFLRERERKRENICFALYKFLYIDLNSKVLILDCVLILVASPR